MKMPKSKATNAYDLLSDVATLALEEPKRIAMRVWKRRGVLALRGDGLKVPSCGTVGCIGGWVEILAGKGRTSETVLGLNPDQTDDLFYNDQLCAANNQQTRAHARAVVAHIRRFQKKYAEQLKATPVKR